MPCTCFYACRLLIWTGISGTFSRNGLQHDHLDSYCRHPRVGGSRRIPFHAQPQSEGSGDALPALSRMQTQAEILPQANRAQRLVLQLQGAIRLSDRRSGGPLNQQCKIWWQHKFARKALGSLLLALMLLRKPPRWQMYARLSMYVRFARIPR